MTTLATTTSLYLIEFYTVDEYIRFAWVDAETPSEAEAILKTRKTDYRGMRIGFGELIQITEQGSIAPLRLSGKYSTPLFLATAR